VRTVWIGFDGLRVAVRSAAPEVMAEVERTFRAMVLRPGEDHAGPVVAELAVCRVADGYEITGRHEVAPERGSLEEARRAVRYHATRAFVVARPERFWVHAAAASRGPSAVLIPGSRGRGKSTVITSLAGAGWRFLSDEAVPLDMAGDRATPFPLTPQVRVGPAVALAPEAVAALSKREVHLEASVIGREAVRITEVILVRYQPGASATLERVAPGETALELLESCLNFRHHGVRAVTYAADIARRLPATRLIYGDAAAAARLLNARART
jgi:hypothetical protein